MSPALVQSLFHTDGALLVPAATAAAPWAENMLHGRMVSALAARSVDREYGDAEFRCARLTVDLFRAASLDPVQVMTRLVRDGRRIKVAEAEVVSGGKAIARATALLLRHGAQPAVAPWQAAEWDVPAPEALTPEDTPESRFIPVETRSIVPGGYRASGRKRIWLREVCPLVDDEAWTPLTRVAAVADLTNALANTDEQPNHFINADVTLYLGRVLEGEWVGLDVVTHISAAGLAVGSCELYDTKGRCGVATVAALAAPGPLKLPEGT